MEILQQIADQIAGKAAVYTAIASKVNAVTEDEAAKIIDGELESYLTRLYAYLLENKQATLTLAQGCNIFLDVIQSGLSFSPVANHVYVSRMKGTGTSIGYKVTADGAIYQAQRAGAIAHLSEPVLVLNGEQFSIISTPEGRHIANHVLSFQGRPQFNIEMFMVGYVYVIYPNGDRELSWISGQRMKELQAKSANPAMYNDESFVQTKVIKHALRKVRRTPFFNQLQVEEDAAANAREFEPMQAPQAIPIPQPQPAQPQYAPPPAPQQEHSQYRAF